MTSKDAPPQKKQAPLFRPQAVAFQSRRLDGEVLLNLSMPMSILIAVIVLLIAGVSVFASLATYARVETVPGWVVPEGGLIRITAQQGGVVEALNVVEADSVQIGDSLAQMRLSPNLGSASAGQEIEAQLREQIEAFKAQTEAEREKLNADEANLNARRSAMQRELEQSRDRIRVSRRRLELIEASGHRVREIADLGFTSLKSVEESEMSLLSAQQDLLDAEAGMLALEREMADINAAQQALPLSIRAADAQARVIQAQLAQQNTQTVLQNTYHVGASVAGRVVALPVARGQTVAPQAVIAVLTPENSKLGAQLFVPSRSIGFISPGQEVRLMYEAFPYQKFGTAKGHIRSISRTVLAPTEIALPGFELHEPVFRVDVTLEGETVSAYGETILIQPAMLLSAGIIIERRTLFQWLLDPLYAVGRFK